MFRRPPLSFPNISFIFPRKHDLGTPNILSRENAGKAPGNSLFPMKEKSNAKEKTDPGSSGKCILGIPSGAFWDDSPLADERGAS